MPFKWVTLVDAAAQLGTTVADLKSQIPASELVFKNGKLCIEPSVLNRLKSQKKVVEWRMPKNDDDKK